MAAKTIDHIRVHSTHRNIDLNIQIRQYRENLRAKQNQ